MGKLGMIILPLVFLIIFGFVQGWDAPLSSWRLVEIGLLGLIGVVGWYIGLRFIPI